MTDADALVAVVEEVRSTSFPDIPPDLVREIVEIQVRYQDDSAEALRRTRQAISRAAVASVAGRSPEETP